MKNRVNRIEQIKAAEERIADRNFIPEMNTNTLPADFEDNVSDWLGIFRGRLERYGRQTINIEDIYS